MKYTMVQPYPCEFSEFEQCQFNTGLAVVIDPSTGAQATDPATGAPLVVDPETGAAVPSAIPEPAASFFSSSALLYGVAAVLAYKFFK
jgi:hypothetical protein